MGRNEREQKFRQSINERIRGCEFRTFLDQVDANILPRPISSHVTRMLKRSDRNPVDNLRRMYNSTNVAD